MNKFFFRKHAPFILKKTIGFSLIELMIVLAIIGILAGAAIRSYTADTLSAKIATVLAAGASAQAFLSNYYADNNTLTGATWATNSALDITNFTSSNVQSIAIKNGIITIVTTNAIKNPSTGSVVTIYLTPTANAGVLTWTCTTNSSQNNFFMPSNCQT